MSTLAGRDRDATLLDLHRDLCAAVRRADEAFARFYAADDAAEARQGESRYVIALAQAYAALRTIESRIGATSDTDAVGHAVTAARLVS
jgi:hypothetical protein